MKPSTIFISLGVLAGVSIAVLSHLPDRTDVTPPVSSEAVLEEALAPSSQEAFPTGAVWMLEGSTTDQTPSFQLDEEGSRVSGFSGCNRFNGTYTLTGNALTFADNLAMTRMACVKGAEEEAAFMDTLRATRTWSLKDEALTLSGEDGKALGQFKKAP